MVESDYPFNIRIDRNEKNFDIKSIGHDDFGGGLTHNVSAHPKVDRKTGEMMAFGYDAEKALIHYSLINKNRKVVSNLKIPISSPRMVHDFAITENYVILPDNPMELRPDMCLQGKFIFQFNHDKPSRYGIMKRHCVNPD
jgi:9-cis-epoxycarotenoid dioxygenase